MKGGVLYAHVVRVNRPRRKEGMCLPSQNKQTHIFEFPPHRRTGVMAQNFPVRGERNSTMTKKAMFMLVAPLCVDSDIYHCCQRSTVGAGVVR